MGDGRAEIALNILGVLIGLYYAVIIKTRCSPALRWRGASLWCYASCDGARDRKKAIH